MRIVSIFLYILIFCQPTQKLPFLILLDFRDAYIARIKVKVGVFSHFKNRIFFVIDHNNIYMYFSQQMQGTVRTFIYVKFITKPISKPFCNACGLVEILGNAASGFETRSPNFKLGAVHKLCHHDKGGSCDGKEIFFHDDQGGPTDDDKEIFISVMTRGVKTFVMIT